MVEAGRVEAGSVEVCASDALKPGDVTVVAVEGTGRIAVFRTDDGQLFAIRDRCSHQEAWLSDGFLEGCLVECPLHASMFDLATGLPSGPPATVAVPTYPVDEVTSVITVRL